MFSFGIFISKWCLIKKNIKYFSYCQKLSKWGCIFVAENLVKICRKKVDINLEIIKRLVTFVGIKKARPKAPL